MGRIDGKAVSGAEVIDLAVLDEAVGPADADHRDGAAQILKGFNDGGAEAAHSDVVFKGDEGGDTAGVGGEDFPVDRFDEARVDDRGGVAVALQAGGELRG